MRPDIITLPREGRQGRPAASVALWTLYLDLGLPLNGFPEGSLEPVWADSLPGPSPKGRWQRCLPWARNSGLGRQNKWIRRQQAWGSASTPPRGCGAQVCGRSPVAMNKKTVAVRDALYAAQAQPPTALCWDKMNPLLPRRSEVGYKNADKPASSEMWAWLGGTAGA